VQRSSVVSWRSVLVSILIVNMLLQAMRRATYRLGGSSLRLPWDLLMGSYVLICSSSGRLDVNVDCDSSSLISSDASCVLADPVEA